MPLASIPRISRERQVRAKPAKQNTGLTVFLCLLLAAYIGFIGFSLVTHETAVESQAAAVSIATEDAQTPVSAVPE